MRRFFSVLYALAAAACTVTLGAVGYLQWAIPDEQTVVRGDVLTIGAWVSEQPADGPSATAAARAGAQYDASLCLFGIVPIKSVSVRVTESEPVVTVCGTPFGIKLYTDGVLVVGLGDVETAAGTDCPARRAGICVGDAVLSVDGAAVSTNRELSARIAQAGGRTLTLLIRRDGVEFTAEVTPVRAADGGLRAGMWVRDSTAGIGMLTFFDPESGAFGGLGHAVSDGDTGDILPIGSGEIVPARIFGIKKSVRGTPGELQGTFELGTLGSIGRNCTEGLFGKMSIYPATGRTMPVAMRRQVHTGTAQVLTTVDGVRPTYYDIEVEQVHRSAGSSRSLVIRITDPELLSLTGGVVQGLSGSPIVQDGRLIAAVTHVLVNDPKRGYAVFAETMLSRARETVQAMDAAA